MKKIVILVISTLMAGSVFAATDIESGTVWINGSQYSYYLSNGYYEPIALTPSPEVGAFSLTDDLYFTDIYAVTEWRGTNLDEGTFSYRISEVGNESGDFKNLQLEGSSQGMNFRWLADKADYSGVNLLSGLEANKTYALEVYFSGTSVNGDSILNNEGNNYTFTFATAAAADVVPEPGTMALVGLGVVALGLRRFKRG